MTEFSQHQPRRSGKVSSRSTWIGWLASLLCMAFAGGAGASTEIEVLDTFPAGDSVTLASNGNFYLRIGYSTTEPVQIWVQPYYQGREVGAGTSPSPVYSGSGEALGWFFFLGTDEHVDEVRIRAGDGTKSGTQVVAIHPVRVVAGTSAASTKREPAWVIEMRAENERLQHEAYEQRMNTPSSAGETLFFGVFMIAALGLGIAGLYAPWWAIKRWQGGWRIAAMVPAVMTGFVVLRIVVGTAIDPTSHNLWPFEVLMIGALSIAIIGVLLAVRRFAGVPA